MKPLIESRGYKEIVFKSEAKARKYQAAFKKDYGYRPSLFIRKQTGEFKIIKPYGLEKIRRR